MGNRLWGLALISLGLLGACGRPVVRSEKTEAVVPLKKATLEELQAQGADLKKRLWILPFIEASNATGELAKIAMADVLAPRMVEAFGVEKSPYIVPEQEQQSLKDLNVDSSMDTSEAAKMARGSGVTGFIRGEITTLTLTEKRGTEGLLNNVTLDLKLGVTYEVFDSTSGRRLGGGTETQIYSETRSDIFGTEMSLPELDRKLQELSSRLAQKLLYKTAGFADKMGWEGRVVRTDSSKIYVNAGRRTGIQVGDVLKVVDPSKEIRDPSTGAYLGQAPGRIKGTLKVIQFFGLDGSVAVIQSGGGVRPNDRVELY